MANSEDAVLSDIDHTLYRDSLGMDIIEWLVQRHLLHMGFADRFLEMKRRWQARETPYEEYVRVVSDFLDQDGLSGKEEAIFCQAADEIVAEKGKHVFVFTRELIFAAQACGYEAAALSQSPEYAVSVFAKQWGFDHAHGTHYFVDAGRKLTGKRAWSKKDQTVKKLFAERRWRRTNVISIGDSPADAPMFEAANYPIAFNPSRELERIARSLGIPVVKEGNGTINIWHQDRTVSAEFFHEASIGDILPTPVAVKLDKRLHELGYDVR